MNKTITDKSKQDANIISLLENKISELTKKLNEHLIDKETAVASVQKKYELLQQKLLDYTCSNKENNKLNKDNLIDVINDSIIEFNVLFQNRTDKIYNILKDIKDNMFNTDGKSSEIVEKINMELKDVIQFTKKNMEEGYKNSVTVIENEIKSKLQKKFDWQNKHIDELMKFKIKAINLELKISSLEEKNKNLEKLEQATKDENISLNKLLNEKNCYIKRLKDDLVDTEDYNAKLKDFILSGKNIEDYEEFLKNIGK